MPFEIPFAWPIAGDSSSPASSTSVIATVAGELPEADIADLDDAKDVDGSKGFV